MTTPASVRSAEQALDVYITSKKWDAHNGYKTLAGKRIHKYFCCKFFSHALGVYSQTEKLSAAQALCNTLNSLNSLTNDNISQILIDSLNKQHKGALSCGQLGTIYQDVLDRVPELKNRINQSKKSKLCF